MIKQARGSVRLRRFGWRIAGWGTAAVVFALPFIAMQFINQANWTGFDFLFLALLICVVTAASVWTLGSATRPAFRAGIGFALAAAVLTIWVNAAVGMIGSEDNPWNLMFLGVLTIALGGALLGRFQPRRMARAMKAAAAFHLVASVIGATMDLRGGLLSATFGGLWLLSARSFGKASSDPTAP